MFILNYRTWMVARPPKLDLVAINFEEPEITSISPALTEIVTLWAKPVD